MQGSGLQVVEVEGGSYRLETEPLKRILLRDEVKDLPVAVISVAGAYRGGKSFLLNFFLRYIDAPHSSQLDGSWVGEEHVPLEGFSWRGGATRNTTGIVIWSEPFIATLHTGEKVAVILMDTQGTFDSSSTVRDCSTIFALSTLLSSIQIYNLSQIIWEDDLQHLQLFTEYGNLIKDKNTKAFQALEFLVRDWPNAADYPYGSSGGNMYLEEKLQIHPGMKDELKNLRDHIRSSFQFVSCFLMPHPGLEVIEPDFKGQVKELSPKFKTYIKELTTHIFGPARLKPKEIGGEKVTASGLYNYFETYVKLFNSDKIPSPTSIMEATAQAGLLLAFEESRRMYEIGMESECGVSMPSLPAHDLEDVHKTHATRATTAFTDKKKMGSKQDADKYLSKLKEELKARASQYAELNIGKISKTIRDAKDLYETRTGQIKSEQILCVHPLDLEQVHQGALQAAVDFFDSNRRTISNKEDKDRSNFITSFEQQYELLKLVNERNNRMVVMELRLEYWQTMERQCSGDILSESEFQNAHQEALDSALDSFKEKRNHPDCHDVDNFKIDLIEMIQNCFGQMREINKSKNKAAIQAGIRAYDGHMASTWDPRKECLHPGDLDQAKEDAERKAMTEFRPTRVSLGKVYFDTTDDDEKILAEVLEERFKEIKKNNNSSNATAVTASVNLYSEEMVYNCGFSKWWLLFGVPYVVNKTRRNKYHNESKEKALDLFYKTRRASSSNVQDNFMSNLQDRIAEIRKKY